MNLPDEISFADAYEPAMNVQTQAEADERLAALVQLQTRRFGTTTEEAEKLVKTNLGYYAAYFSNETRERVERLFGCQHPYFGAIAVNGAPTPDEALQIGIRAGRAMSQR